MIIFINGAFGVGKTTSAQQIVEVLPNSMLYDPEEVGYMLWNILRPIGLDGDFQDYAPWRPLVAAVAKELKDAYNRTLVIPMTIWREAYFKEVISGLRRIDPDIHHFCLTAPLQTIHERLYQRAEQEAGAWVYQQTAKCIDAFQSDLFAEQIDTTTMLPDAVVAHILKRVGYETPA